jgi:hypothetical protein
MIPTLCTADSVNRAPSKQVCINKLSVGLALLFVPAILSVFWVSSALAEASNSAVGFQGNLGVMVALDGASYFGEPIDLYPEVGIWLEQFPVAVGGTVGLIYRSLETTYHGTFSGTYSEKGSLLVVPLMLRGDITIPPGAPADISLYFGGGFGLYVVLDGSQNTAVAISGRGGMSIRLDPIRLYGEVRLEPTIGGRSQLGALLITSGAAVALPL